MADNNFKWYALKAMSGKEQKVKEYIENACVQTDLGRLVSQVLLPMETVSLKRGNKRSSKERLLMPGYVLVECKPCDESFGRLREIPNVINFLNVNRSHTPTPVTQSEINRLLGHIDESGQNIIEEFPYVVGDNVKVTDGPFNGFIGVIDEIMHDKKKIKVEVTIFGRKTPLELSFNQVDKE